MGTPARAEDRVATGNPELDEILSGGLVGHRPYLIVGPAGTGKTTLALQFLCEGVRRGERCLMVTLEEPPNEMKLNHRGLRPELDQVHVFDAIPDVMRYERTPFKDIAAVREAVPFAQVPLAIRRTPELSSVEVTFTALEQTLKMEIARRSYSRLVIDSLTALQYFCMKGVDEIVGAQTFLRFLSDLRATTVLTVEAPLEDVDTPERLLARGEIRLFRWELEGRTVRALGVEKFRGSPHDIRLHPYRISPRGLDINLALTISRDTRQIVDETAPAVAPAVEVPVAIPVGVDPLQGLEEDLEDLAALAIPLEEVRTALAASASALGHERTDEALQQFLRARQLVSERVELLVRSASGVPAPAISGAAEVTLRRLAQRAVEARTGRPPIAARDLLPVTSRITWIVNRLSAAPTETAAAVPAAPPPSPAIPAPVPVVSAPVPVPAVVRASASVSPASSPPLPPPRSASPPAAIQVETARPGPSVPVPAWPPPPPVPVRAASRSDAPPLPTPPVAAPASSFSPSPAPMELVPRRMADAAPLSPLPNPANPTVRVPAESVASPSDGRPALPETPPTLPDGPPVPLAIPVQGEAIPPGSDPAVSAQPKPPKPRKRRAPTVRKKPVEAADQPPTALAPADSSPPAASPGPGAPAPASEEPAPPTEVSPAPKPRRRSVRKKKPTEPGVGEGATVPTETTPVPEGTAPALTPGDSSGATGP